MQALAEIEPLKSFQVQETLNVSPDKIDEVAGKLLHWPDQYKREMPLVHHFAPGVYLREILMLAGTFVIGFKHKTKHFNIALTGSAAVMMHGKLHHIIAPCVFVSEAGVQKVLHIQQTMRWITVHANPDDEICIEKLEDRLREPSPAYDQYLEEMKQLKELTEGAQ